MHCIATSLQHTPAQETVTHRRNPLPHLHHHKTQQQTKQAVHPQDPRYTHLHGKCVVHPFNGRRIPIVCDDVLVGVCR